MNPRESEFQKIQKLGTGSFGVVWLVKQVTDGTFFALKEVDLRKPGMLQMMHEVDAMKKLPPHKNVVRLHDHWLSADGKDLWLLLEYCSRGTLMQFVYSSMRLPDDALLDLCVQLLHALCLFEQNRIIHNDIKLDNVFIAENSTPKMGDLGMARFTSMDSMLTSTPGGTPLFQSPEVLSKEKGVAHPPCFPEYAASEISYQSDVYSLGVVMWSMIMRRLPDRAGCVAPLTPSLVANSNLRELVNNMLQPNPARRHRASHLILRLVSASGLNMEQNMLSMLMLVADARSAGRSPTRHRFDYFGQLCSGLLRFVKGYSSTVPCTAARQ
jgi:serine/threonine protein kinase